MAELSFIKNGYANSLGDTYGTPGQIDIDDLIKGAQEALDILTEEPDEDGSLIWDDEDRETAKADLDALAEILAEAGYSTDGYEEIDGALRGFRDETGGTLIEEDQLEQRARDLYEDSNLPTIISSNINWQGVVDDMIENTYEVVINHGTYYGI